MNDRRTNSTATQRVNSLAVAYSFKIILLAVVVIVVSTLYPFKFSLSSTSPLQVITQIVRNFRYQSSFLDVAANIVLFMPLGFGIGSVLAKRKYLFWQKLFFAIVLSGGFSLAIELLQVFLPGRKPTPLDVVSNATGGGVGFLCFYCLGRYIYTTAAAVMRRSRIILAKISLSYLIAALGIYFVLAGWLVFSWQGSSLKGWYDGFPLSVGHDYSFSPPYAQLEMGRGWKGNVADLVLRDRAFSRSQVESFFANPSASLRQDKSVVAAYPLRGQQGQEDLTGRSPDLIWQGKPASMTETQGVSLAADHWLQTSEPLKFATNQIRQTSQFTLSALMMVEESTDLAQPIISIADPMGNGNLTVAQLQSSLTISIAIRRANRNVRSNLQIVPNVFQDHQPHRVLITYSGFVTRVYVDSVDQAAVLDMTPNRFQIIVYLLVLVPLAVLIVLVANRVRYHAGIYVAVLAIGTVLPTLLLEGFLASEGERSIRLVNLLVGMAIVGGTILVLKNNVKRPRQFLVLGR